MQHSAIGGFKGDHIWVLHRPADFDLDKTENYAPLILVIGSMAHLFGSGNFGQVESYRYSPCFWTLTRVHRLELASQEL